MILEPREYFAICRQLSDPTDTNTYYIRAVIRNAKTDDLLDTVDLDNQGDQRFRSEWQVPADPSGDGFYITITTTVYTDSGYTNKSSLYGIAEEELLVQKRYNPVYGHGGGVGVDYKKMREIVRQELGIAPKEIDMNPIIKSIKGIKIPKQKEINLANIVKEIGKIQQIIENIDIPKPEKLDLWPAIREIRNIKIPEPERLDLSPVLEEIKNIPEPEKVDFTPVLKELRKITEKLEESINQNKETAENGKADIQKDIKKLNSKLAKGFSLNIGMAGKKAEEPEEEEEIKTKKRKWL